MISVKQIQETLPAWPDEVVEVWIKYFANDIGWPPAEPLGTDRWGGILGKRPLSWWAEVCWHQEHVNCDFGKLSRITQSRVIGIRKEIATKTADALTEKRFKEPFAYLLDNGTFPKAMSAMRAGDGLRFVDGHHRLAAFTAIQLIPVETFKKRGKEKPKLEQAIWIGTHIRSELPLDA